MYQYALQCMLKKKYSSQEFKADVTHYNIVKEHFGFEIDRIFETDLTFASVTEIKRIYTGLTLGPDALKYAPAKLKSHILYQGQYRYNILGKWLQKKKRQNEINGGEFNAFKPDIYYLNNREDYYFKGLWQNWNYFKDDADYIRDCFKFKDLSAVDKSVLDEIQDNNTVGIHIRGGDFKRKPVFDLCTASYYKRAIHVMEKTQGENQSHYMVFTDQPELVKELGLPDCVTIVNSKGDDYYLDMYYMTQCKHLIISNSTFSFWSAILNHNVDKVVVAPEFAIHDSVGWHTMQVPEEWIQIDNR